MDFTQILEQAESGDPSARSELIQAAYDELRQMAAARMANERQDHTLTSTALVHEVSMKLLCESRIPVSNRGQFLAYASKAMRNFLIDHARTRGRQKRGGAHRRFSFDEAMIACHEQRDDFLALDEALESLAQIDARKAQLVEMRYYGGMSNNQIASVLQISVATIKRDWAVARAWLLTELRGHSDSSGDNSGQKDIDES